MELDNISKIGVGTYRVLAGDKAAYLAMAAALKAGCTVIDTAPNYALGEAETVVGKLLRHTDRNRIFLMTKAGYAQGLPEETVHRLGMSRFTKLPNGQWYSLYPDFLRYRLRESLQRLGTAHVDGFFLHNPHYLAGSPDFRQQLQAAFELMEELVDLRLIRYYGVSSNTLSWLPDRGMNIQELENLAVGVRSEHHFRLLQFPLNMIENEVMKAGADGMNLITACRKSGFKTFSNRPLNAYLPDGSLLRLAGGHTPPYDAAQLDTVFVTASDRFIALTGTPEITGEWSRLIRRWSHFSSAEEVNLYFSQVLALAFGDLDPDAATLLKQIEICCRHKADLNMSERTTAFFNHIYPGLELQRHDYAAAAIRYCQLQGVDCVLTAPRKPAYIKEIEHLLTD